VVPKLDRLARSVPARAIGDSLAAGGVRLSIGGTLYDPNDPIGKMFFSILATFAEFELDNVADAHPRGNGDRPRQRQAQADVCLIKHALCIGGPVDADLLRPSPWAPTRQQPTTSHTLDGGVYLSQVKATRLRAIHCLFGSSSSSPENSGVMRRECG
jgi:Resolvase, N terminal domain